jgi:AcrR family transcriptional regulator
VSTYHHGNLRPALIEAAVELARANGPDGVVLREVARQTGVSHNAAYRHFADRGELLAEVAAVAMSRLAEAMEERVATVTSGSAKARARWRLGEVGRAYVYFALAEPGLFEVAFTPEAHSDPKVGADVGDPYAILGRALDDLVDVGALPAARREGADVVCWAGVHGFAMLHLHGPLREVPAELREVHLAAMLDTIQRGLTGGPSPH